MKDNYQEEKLALRIDETDDVRQGGVKTFSSSEGALNDLTTQSSFDRPSGLKKASIRSLSNTDQRNELLRRFSALETIRDRLDIFLRNYDVRRN